MGAHKGSGIFDKTPTLLNMLRPDIDAFERHATTRQKFCDAKGAFRAFTARHDLGAKRDGHAGARPTVALRVALIIVEFFSHPLFARASAAQEHCRAQRA